MFAGGGKTRLFAFTDRVNMYAVQPRRQTFNAMRTRTPSDRSRKKACPIILPSLFLSSAIARDSCAANEHP